MHRTIAEVIAEFAPERVKAKEADAGLGRLVSNPKARNWDAYEEHYKQMAHDMENTIRAAFEKTFARAYEETIGELQQTPQRPL